ncbi:hypothetical protein FPSE_10674 [Fusarium pseudograminearum CS3096]|uniref:Uncharacterized protein n=1 Tax=Fusarium pseudograminearum (strain CS3096) TaxID=1028729 RepID=K3VXM3_FUSPC|nr:hypothetical protein FPSE_10674 [Fusarium pseudograminearum CS3096]EKJ69150.1 hypothetical protein FPSE_10674 [Fusarium pseudograminearum CS3096]
MYIPPDHGVMGTATEDELCEVAWCDEGQLAVSILYQKLVEWNKRETGKEIKEQRLEFWEMQEAISNLAKLLVRKEMRVIPGAFNSSELFTPSFKYSGLGMATLVVLNSHQSIKRVGAALKSIPRELCNPNVASAQEWVNGSLGNFIHRFVQKEMAFTQHNGCDRHGRRHYFYVWHPDPTWHIAFEEEQARNPLRRNFGGYHHELQTLCLRMRTDREALIWNTQIGGTSVFHLVIPANQPLVVDTKFMFHKALFPLTIIGAQHRGTNLVWLAIRQLPGPTDIHLRSVSILPDPLVLQDYPMKNPKLAFALIVVYFVVGYMYPFWTVAIVFVLGRISSPPTIWHQYDYRLTAGSNLKELGDAVIFTRYYVTE